MVLAVIGGALFGPFTPWSLKRKLGIAGLGCALLFAALAFAYFSDPGQFNGPAWQWLLMFFGMSTLLFIVSTWCLALSHFLGLMRRMVDASTLGERQARSGLV